MTASALTRPGIVRLYGRIPVGECARCERERPLYSRGLCCICRRRCRADGTLADYGYVKADKIAEYALVRSRWVRGPDGELRHPTIPEAAAAAGVNCRTGQRYEAELDAAGQAPWRVTDVNVLYASRRNHTRHAAVSTG